MLKSKDSVVCLLGLVKPCRSRRGTWKHIPGLKSILVPLGCLCVRVRFTCIACIRYTCRCCGSVNLQSSYLDMNSFSFGVVGFLRVPPHVETLEPQFVYVVISNYYFLERQLHETCHLLCVGLHSGTICVGMKMGSQDTLVWLPVADVGH